LHRVEVAYLPGQVEDVVLVSDEEADRPRIADVRIVDVDAVHDLADVVRVPAVVGDQRVDDRHLGTELDQPLRQMRADEPEAAGNEDTGALIGRERGKVHGPPMVFGRCGSRAQPWRSWRLTAT